jgi:hypothetical protein
MLNGIRIYSSNCVWRQILADFGATVLDAPNSTDINFDDFGDVGILTPLELKSLIVSASDNGHVLRTVFGQDVALPHVQGQIVILLYKSGGMTINELKQALGYSPDVTTHTVDTAIYQLRRTYGRCFIRNTNGVYRLGQL